MCLHRRRAGIEGPLFLGIDTHGLSEPALTCALEVLAANGVDTMIDHGGGYTPTPVISHAILAHNRGSDQRPGGRDRDQPVTQPARGRRRQIRARTGQDPSHFHDTATEGLGRSSYERIDAPATDAQKKQLGKLDPDEFHATSWGGEPILAN